MGITSIITLTTDYGLSDSYVASVKGTILKINPEVTIVDVTHLIKPQDIIEASFTIYCSYKYFPQNSIHVVIVDPEVGSKRKIILLKTNYAYFIVPDNGVLSYIINDLIDISSPGQKTNKNSIIPFKLPSKIDALEITNSDYWQKPVSSTFHGRDIIAPVAAHLSRGVPFNKFGDRIEHINIYRIPRPTKYNTDIIKGEIVHIDSFGNIITNIKSSDLSTSKIEIELGNKIIKGLSKFYSQKTGLIALIGSSGYLEISLTNSNAISLLNVKIGDEVLIKIRPDVQSKDS